MKRKILFIALLVLSAVLYAQEAPQEEQGSQVESVPQPAEQPTLTGFFITLGENIFSNVVLNRLDAWVGAQAYAYVTPDSMWTNLTNPWEWDGSEFFTNQFLHPYHGYTFHAAARSNGFNFYEGFLFAAFGSASWELFGETNIPAINDLISTSVGGAALGEMFHRLYLEIPGPLAILVSPMDAFNNLVTARHPEITHNIYSMKFASGIGYTHTDQGSEKAEDMVSTDISYAVVYGDPFSQASVVPYNHFEMDIYAGIGYPFWYSLRLLSDAYLFSFSVLDTETNMSSTGLTLHYDLFAGAQIDYYGQSLDWTYKHKKQFSGGTETEFKAHIGWIMFSVDAFNIYDNYEGMRQIANNYGTGANLKMAFAVQTPQRHKIDLRCYMYQVVNVYQNRDRASGSHFFLFADADYSFPLGKQTSLGMAASLYWQRAFYDGEPDTQRRTFDAKLYFGIAL